MRRTPSLAGRDVVARSIMIEIREGRGCDRPWGPHANSTRPPRQRSARIPLPGILRTLPHLRPRGSGQRAHPIIPTCHYMMGGVPTNVNGQA
ncbi:FAD-binding protein [Shigella flexneri]